MRHQLPSSSNTNNMKVLALLILALLSSVCCDRYRYRDVPIYYPTSTHEDSYNHDAPSRYWDFSYQVQDDNKNQYSGYNSGNAQVHNIYKPTYPVDESNSGYKTDYAHKPAYSDFSYRINQEGKRNFKGHREPALDYGHNESKMGDRTAGSYNVVLPDGRRQIVTYYVDGNSGFVADVRYEPAYKAINEPTYESTIAPSYKRV